MKRMIALVLLCSVVFLAGCNCMSGLGRDVQKAGQWMEKTAEQNK